MEIEFPGARDGCVGARARHVRRRRVFKWNANREKKTRSGGGGKFGSLVLVVRRR